MSADVLPDGVRGWLADRHQAVLVTLRRDGSPQSSNVAVGYDLGDGLFRVSVTDDRAKTRNVRRDPRVVLHVLGDDFWTYCSVAGEASLTALTTTPGDEVGRELLGLYEAIRGELHPDPDEFFQAMVDDRRLVLRVRPTSYAGNNLPG